MRYQCEKCGLGLRIRKSQRVQAPAEAPIFRKSVEYAVRARYLLGCDGGRTRVQ
jgi:hypothetical protein